MGAQQINQQINERKAESSVYFLSNAAAAQAAYATAQNSKRVLRAYAQRYTLNSITLVGGTVIKFQNIV